MGYSAYSVSDTGLCRDNNEDSVLIADTFDEYVGYLYGVADGLGGYAAGETASRIVCERLEQLFPQEMSELRLKGAVKESDILFLLEKIIYKIHREVFQLGRDDSRLYGMGSTLSFLLLRKNKAFIAQVGDSRIYRIRSGKLEQITEDQTEIQHYIELGMLTPEEARTHHLRHVLSQAIGGKKDSFKGAVTKVEPLEEGDKFLICSDGLYEMVPDAIIEKIVIDQTAAKPERVCENLLKEALQNGGKDNVTLLLVQKEVGKLSEIVDGSRGKRVVQLVKSIGRRIFRFAPFK